MLRSFRFLLVATSLFGALRLTAADLKMDSMASEIVTAYAKVTTALAADNLSAAKAAAAEVADHAGMAKNSAVAGKAKALAKATKIEDARKELVGLTAAVEPLAKKEKDYVLMNCPMAGDWIQKKGSTKNPYMGKTMLECGGPKEAK